MVEHSNFTQSLRGTREYNNIYIQESGNSRVVEFRIVLTSVTKSHDIGSFCPVGYRLSLLALRLYL